MARIFLSYRRDDSAGHAGRIFDHLSNRFDVFIDVEAIEAGENFVRAIEASMSECDTVVLVIGRRWAGSDAAGKRRLDDPADYLRQEIEAAFRFGIDVVPVLVGGAQFPPGDLPESIAGLAQLNALSIDDKTFAVGIEQLVDVLEKTTARGSARRRAENVARRRRRERRAPVDKSAALRTLQRLLLFYAPAHRAMWIVHVLFYIALFFAVITPALVVMLGESASLGLLIFTVYLGVSLALRTLAAIVEPGNPANRFLRWWLLYKPVRARTFVLHVLFWIMALAFVLVLPQQIIDAQSQESDIARLIGGVYPLLLFAIATLMIRELAAARDPFRRTGTDRNWFARLLYIWRPRRAATWIPRIVFYATVLAFLLVAPRVFADHDGNFQPAVDFSRRGAVSYAALLMLVMIAARGWATTSAEIRPRHSAQLKFGRRVQQLLLLHAPSRSAQVVPQSFFWIAVMLLGTLLLVGDFAASTLGLERENLVLVTSVIVLAVASQRWAQRFSPWDRKVDSFPARSLMPSGTVEQVVEKPTT
jgi:hypothetical protein